MFFVFLDVAWCGNKLQFHNRQVASWVPPTVTRSSMSSTLYTDPFLKRSNSDPCFKKKQGKTVTSVCVILYVNHLFQIQLIQLPGIASHGSSATTKSFDACLATMPGLPVPRAFGACQARGVVGKFVTHCGKQETATTWCNPPTSQKTSCSGLRSLFHCKKHKLVALMLPSESLGVFPAFHDETWDSEFKNRPNTKKMPRNQPPRVWASAPPYLGVMTRALRDPMKKHHRGRLAQKSAGNLAAKVMALRGDSLRMIVTLRTIIIIIYYNHCHYHQHWSCLLLLLLSIHVNINIYYQVLAWPLPLLPLLLSSYCIDVMLYTICLGDWWCSLSKSKHRPASSMTQCFLIHKNIYCQESRFKHFVTFHNI